MRRFDILFAQTTPPKHSDNSSVELCHNPLSE